MENSAFNYRKGELDKVADNGDGTYKRALKMWSAVGESGTIRITDEEYRAIVRVLCPVDLLAPTVGKYSNLRDSLLHYLASGGWSNEASGDVDAPTRYFWRMTLDYADTAMTNTEFTSVIAEWCEEHNVPDNEALRAGIRSNWLITEDSNGIVHVAHYNSVGSASRAFQSLENIYEDWAGQDDE